MATLETSPEANCDRQAYRRTKPLIGARATALLKNNQVFPNGYQKKLVQIIVVVLNSAHYSFSWTLNNLLFREDNETTTEKIFIG